MYFDSHAHLDDKRFKHDRRQLIKEIFDSGVSNIVNIGADMESSKRSIELAEDYEFIYAAVGVHPHDTKEMKDSDIETLREMSKKTKVRAIGEIGLDFYYDHSDRDIQRFWFRKQLDLAKELDMPVVIHDRDAHKECIDILKEKSISKGVMHCFSGSAEMAKIILDMGFYVSFTGVITFSNARQAIEALKVVPMDRLMIETDCPYLSPEPFRGQRNHSGYVKYVAEKIAEIKGISTEEVAHQTSNNAKKFFGIE